MSPYDKARQRKPARTRRSASASGVRERAATVRRVRGILNRTQAQLAAALGVSEKAVQSYEQGWRKVPVRVIIQLFVLLALYRKQGMDEIPCWEIRKCAAALRENCASFTVGRGQFCWLIGAKRCRSRTGKSRKVILPCMECPVVKRLLSGWRVMKGAV